MLKHPILIAILLIALAASGCVAGQPVSPEQMAAVAPTVVDMVSQIAPQLAAPTPLQLPTGRAIPASELKADARRQRRTGDRVSRRDQLMESGTWLLSGQGDVVVTLGTTEGQSIVEPHDLSGRRR